MLIVGDISGIQDYLFDISGRGGGQSRRLRARSFYLQALTECAALRVMHAAGWQTDSILLTAAGRFVLSGDGIPDDAAGVREAALDMERWLLDHLGGRVRIAMDVNTAEGDVPDLYLSSLQGVQKRKYRSWSGIAQNNGAWNPSRLILPPLDTPCSICGREPARHKEQDTDTGAEYHVGERCRDDLELGKRLPRARWMEVRTDPAEGSMEIVGVHIRLLDDFPTGTGTETLGVLSLSDETPPSGAAVPVLTHRLARHVPVDRGRPVDFREIARHARGDSLLAVLKMDVDHLGKYIGEGLARERSLKWLGRTSRKLDRFFSETLDRELTKPPWDMIYTVFSGGDDLILIGPWDVMIKYAGHVHGLVSKEFETENLTISGGIAFFKPNSPVLHAVHQASDALDLAKESGRNRCAALGAVLEWPELEHALGTGTRLADWVDARAMNRGWLPTMLKLCTERREAWLSVPEGLDPAKARDLRLKRQRGMLASSRLDYHIVRNYPKPNDRDESKREVRQWADAVLSEFDDWKPDAIRVLPAALRYALTATRGEE